MDWANYWINKGRAIQPRGPERYDRLYKSIMGSGQYALRRQVLQYSPR